MKRIGSFFLALLLFSALALPAGADAPRTGAVTELFSAEGVYTDDVGNTESYAYHIPQLAAESPAAREINAEIRERFGSAAERQFQNMDGGYSLWSWHIEWHPYWHGDQLFLLLTADTNGGFTDRAAYGYDFAADERITNERLLSELGIPAEQYLERLREKVGRLFEDMYKDVPDNIREQAGMDEMRRKTLDWADLEQPVFLDGAGNVVTIVKVASIAGADWYYHQVTCYSAEETAALPAAKSPEEIAERKLLRVGTAGDYQPMSYLDPDTGKYVGFDAELAEDLAAALGVELEFVKTSWPTLMEDTLAGKFDLAICGITITDARREKALMSEGYFGNGKTVLCRAEDADRYTSLEAINRPEVRVMENPGGLNEKFARENLPDAALTIHPVNQEIPGLIAAGEADVMITEIMEAGYYVSRDHRLAAPLIHEPFTHGQLGVMMPKGSEALLQYVNSFLETEKSSGRIEALAEQYIYGGIHQAGGEALPAAA